MNTEINPRDIVFVHGVQWESNRNIKGYSDSLQHNIRLNSGSSVIGFHEVLWSDIVEEIEQELLNGKGVIGDLITGDYLDLIFDLYKIIGDKTDFQGNIDDLKSANLKKLIKKQDGFIRKALSAVLDLALYHTDLYGGRIRAEVRKTLNTLEYKKPPVLFGHSLGSVILLDILKENIDRNKLHVGGFVTAGSPIGLFRKDRDHPRYKEFTWTNFYDNDDLVTYWNPLKRFGYSSVFDKRIDTHELPFYSHTKYWSSSAVAAELVDLSLTM